MSMSAPRSWVWLVALAVVTLLIYGKTVGHGFTYDDRQYVAAYTRSGPNPLIIESRPVTDFFRYPMGYGVQDRGRGFRPLTVASYAWTHQLFRSPIPPRPHPDYPEARIQQEWSDPAWPHHVLNLALHLLATGLVFLLVRGFLPSGPAAVLGAAVFALHPLRSDQVISIVGRGELLAFVLGLGGALLYVRALDATGRRRVGALVGATACTFGAFLSKEGALGWVVATPVLAGLLRGRWRGQLVAFLVAVAVPAAAFFGLRAMMIAAQPMARDFALSTDTNPLFAMSFLERLPTAVMVWGYGLWKLFVPYPLASDYGARVFDLIGFADPRVYLGAAALAAVLVLGYLARRRQPMLAFAAVVFLGFSFLTSNVPVPIETIFGERLYYTPGLAVGLLAAAAIGWAPRVGGAVLGAFLVAGAILCVQRTFDWESNETLFAADAENQPRSISLQLNMARISRLREDWPARQRYLERVLALDPDSFLAHNELAADAMADHRYGDALPHLDRAVAGLEAGRGFDREQLLPRVLLNRGLAKVHLEDTTGAAADLDRVRTLLAAEPPTVVKHRAALARMGLAWRAADLEALASCLHDPRGTLPGDPAIELFRGLLQYGRGDSDAAVATLGRALARTGQGEPRAFALEVMARAITEGRDRARLQAAADLRHEGFFRRAAKRYEALTAQPSTRGPAFDNWLWCQWEIGDVAAVRRVYDLAVAALPGDARLEVHAGLLAHAAGDHASAVRSLRRATSRMRPSPEALRAHLAWAESAHAVGHAKEAAAIVERLLGTRGLLRRARLRLLALRERIVDR